MTTPREETFYEFFALQAEADIYDTDDVYLFTWNPDPNRYPSSKPYEQYKILFDLVLRNADKCFSTFAFTPELTQNGNTHIHGWYVIKDKVKYFKWWLPKCKQFGFTKVDKWKRKPEALEYYRKDIELMNELFENKRLPVPLTHENISVYKQNKTCKKKLKLIPRSKEWCDITKYFKI